MNYSFEVKAPTLWKRLKSAFTILVMGKAEVELIIKEPKKKRGRKPKKKA